MLRRFFCVITSYSIHYTKLYDNRILVTRLGGEVLQTLGTW